MGIVLPNGDIVETRPGTVSPEKRQLLGVAEPLRPAPDRSASGQVVWFTNFEEILPPLWNDALGLMELDDDIRCFNLPSLRLDTGGQSAGATTNPGRTANTSGVIGKTRIHDNFAGRWGLAMWFRFSGLNNTSNSKLSLSIYNRTGIDSNGGDPLTGSLAHHFRVWLDPDGNNNSMHARILDGDASATANGGTPTNPTGTAVYADVLASTNQNGAGTHTYDVATGRLDRVGGWHYIKMVVDFNTGEYRWLQLDSKFIDLTTANAGGAYHKDVTDSGGFAGMHMSVEYHGNTTTPRFVNIAAMRATLEA